MTQPASSTLVERLEFQGQGPDGYRTVFNGLLLEAAARTTELEAQVEFDRLANKKLSDLLDIAIERVKALEARALAAESQLERVRAETWQPIETAPKDGTRVLLFTDELTPPTIQAQWRPYEAHFDGAGEWVDVWNNDPIETNSGPIKPTHWRPLPAPPQQKTDQTRSQKDGSR